MKCRGLQQNKNNDTVTVSVRFAEPGQILGENSPLGRAVCVKTLNTLKQSFLIISKRAVFVNAHSILYY